MEEMGQLIEISGTLKRCQAYLARRETEIEKCAQLLATCVSEIQGASYCKAEY